MADNGDLKSPARKSVRVRLPSCPYKINRQLAKPRCGDDLNRWIGSSTSYKPNLLTKGGKMGKILKLLLVGVCFLMVMSPCFAKEYPISKETNKALTACLENIVNAGEARSSSIMSGEVKLSMMDLTEFNRIDKVMMQVASEIKALTTMIEIEVSHAAKQQLDNNAINLIKAYIGYIKSSLVLSTKEFKSDLNSNLIESESVKSFIKSGINNFDKTSAVLDKAVSEL